MAILNNSNTQKSSRVKTTTEWNGTESGGGRRFLRCHGRWHSDPSFTDSGAFRHNAQPSRVKMEEEEEKGQPSEGCTAHRRYIEIYLYIYIYSSSNPDKVSNCSKRFLSLFFIFLSVPNSPRASNRIFPVDPTCCIGRRLKREPRRRRRTAFDIWTRPVSNILLPLFFEVSPETMARAAEVDTCSLKSFKKKMVVPLFLVLFHIRPYCGKKKKKNELDHLIPTT